MHGATVSRHQADARLTPDLFVRKMKLILKMRVNAGRNKRILYHKTNKEASAVLCYVVKHLGSG